MGIALRLFYWQVVRYAARHPLLAVLNVASIALGVSVYLAIQIANQSADRALRAGVDLVAGKADLEVRGEMSDATFAKIKKLPGVRAATPLVEGLVTLPQLKGEYLQILGLDPFTNAPFVTFRVGTGTAGGEFDFERWLTDPSVVAISKDFAARYSVKNGDPLEVLVNSEKVMLTVGFVIETEASMEGSGARLAAMDIASAQQLLGVLGKVSSVQVLVEAGRGDEVSAAIRKLVPETVSVAPPAQRNRQVGQMLQAFQLNLSALSLVALLVGMFLVFNTVSASVVRRRQEIGILRSNGASRLQIRALFLGEAALYGVLGLIAGGVGGVLLANVLVGAVGQTISSLYILLSIDRLFFSGRELAFAWLAGMGSVILAAWIPAREAANLPPVRALNAGYELDRSARPDARLPWAGAGLIALAAGASWVSLHRWPWLGFASAFFLLAGCSLFAPLLTQGGSFLLQKASGMFLLGSLAAQNLRRSLARVSLTVAALASAVAMMTGVSVMIFSFRETINTWVKRSLVADLFIAPASNETIGLTAYMPPDALAWLEARPEVEVVDSFREVRLPYRERIIRLSVVHGHRRDNLRFLEGDHQRRNARLFEPGVVLVSEPFARKNRVRAEDRLTLPTPAGMRDFVVGGTYYDYTSDEGTVLMARENYDRWWNDARVHSLAVYLRQGQGVEAVADAFRAQYGEGMSFSLYSNRSIRERVFEIFEQTFAVTSILRIIAIGVAVIGIFLTLTTLVTERVRELAVLRSVGGSQGQIRWMVLIEGGMVGLLASVLGLVSGCGLALVLTFVVNKAFFGWTIQLAWPWWSLLATPLWIVPVALLGGWVPAWRAAKMELAPALRSS